jgi:tetratricopeptide (TPR) repeat protein
MRLQVFRVCAAAVALATIDPCFAQADLCHAERNPGAHALNEITWKQLNAIYEDVGEERYGEAYDDLQKMLGRAGRDNYLQAVLNQALAQVEWARGNYIPSLRYFEQAVALDVLPDATHFALMYQIAQLYFMNDQYEQALDRLELWFCKAPEEKISATAHVLQAAILARKEDYRGALSAIDTAIAMDPEPREQWYQLKLAAHFELKQYPEAAETLGIMIAEWPDSRDYWLQLAQVRMQLNQDEMALAVLALAYRKNLLIEQSDITLLCSLYSHSDLPYKAAEILEKAILDGIVPADQRHWTLVADAWYAAEELEKALRAYGEAGEVAEDGNIDLRRAYLLVDLEHWPGALEALDQALQKGGLDDRKTGEAYLLRGVAWFNLENYDKAGADWGRAGRHEKSREAARQWMNHLQEEKRRRAS